MPESAPPSQVQRRPGATLRASSVSRSFEGVRALDEVTLELHLHAFVTLIGLISWGAVRAAAWHHTDTERITVRAAFNAHTRGGWRAARRDEGGVIALGAPASIAVWDVPGSLTVQTPDSRVAAWSTDPRAGVPHLPDLHPDLELPACVMTLVGGEVVFEHEGVQT